MSQGVGRPAPWQARGKKLGFTIFLADFSGLPDLVVKNHHAAMWWPEHSELTAEPV
jgi:hypothetical protein